MLNLKNNHYLKLEMEYFMDRILEICRAFNYSLNDLSKMIDVEEEIIKSWINKESTPDLKYYRDLAIIFGTSVFHLKNNLGKVVTSSYNYWIDNKILDGFWGHAGIILNQSNYTKWYPISSQEVSRIGRQLDSDVMSLSIETINNRLLIIRKKSIKLLRTLDDASDGTEDWEIDWDDYQGLGCEEIYNLLHEHFELSELDPEKYIESTSHKAREVVNDFIEKYNLNYDNYRELIYESIIHHTDGKKTKMIINEDCLYDLTLQFDSEIDFIKIEDYTGDIIYFNVEKIEMIEIPLFLYHKSLQKVLEENDD